MKQEIKIPPFISRYLGELPFEEKNEAIERYKRWYNGEYTQLFIQDLEHKLDKLVQDDEKDSDFLSWFSFAYKKAANRAKRLIIRDLINKLDYKQQ